MAATYNWRRESVSHRQPCAQEYKAKQRGEQRGAHGWSAESPARRPLAASREGYSRYRRPCASGWGAYSEGSEGIAERTALALSPVTGPGSTAFSSVASAFSFQHHVHSDPAAELRVLKRILLRECLLSRLEDMCRKLRRRYRRPAAGSTGIAERLVQGTEDVMQLLSRMREATVSVVEAILLWREEMGPHQRPPPAFIWHGENYLLKITNDLNFLAGVDALVSALKMHPARFCRNPLMLVQTLDEQRRDGEVGEMVGDVLSPRIQKKAFLQQVTQVLLDEEAFESERERKRQNVDGNIPARSSRGHSGRDGVLRTPGHVNDMSYDRPPASYDSELEEDVPSGVEHQPGAHFSAESSSAFASEDDDVVLRRRRLASWYEEARSQLISLSSSPADEEYFLNARRFWNREGLRHGGAVGARSPSLKRRPPTLAHSKFAGPPVTLTRSQSEGVASRRDGFPIRHGGLSRTQTDRVLQMTREVDLGGIVQQNEDHHDDDDNSSHDDQRGAEVWTRREEEHDELDGDKPWSLSFLTASDIECLLEQDDVLPATTVVCAAIAFLLAEDDQVPEEFCWPQGFEAVALPAQDFLSRLRDRSGQAVSKFKARVLKFVMQREDILPAALLRQGAHTVACLCAWALEELSSCAEFAEWSRFALGAWYRMHVPASTTGAHDRASDIDPAATLLYKSLHVLCKVGASYVLSLFQNAHASGSVTVRAFDRGKAETLFMSLSGKQIASLGANAALSPANLAKALATRLVVKKLGTSGKERLVLAPLASVKPLRKKAAAHDVRRTRHQIGEDGKRTPEVVHAGSGPRPRAAVERVATPKKPSNSRRSSASSTKKPSSNDLTAKADVGLRPQTDGSGGRQMGSTNRSEYPRKKTSTALVPGETRGREPMECVNSETKTEVARTSHDESDDAEADALRCEVRDVPNEAEKDCEVIENSRSGETCCATKPPAAGEALGASERGAVDEVGAEEGGTYVDDFSDCDDDLAACEEEAEPAKGQLEGCAEEPSETGGGTCADKENPSPQNGSHAVAPSSARSSAAVNTSGSDGSVPDDGDAAQGTPASATSEDVVSEPMSANISEEGGGERSFDERSRNDGCRMDEEEVKRSFQTRGEQGESRDSTGGISGPSSVRANLVTQPSKGGVSGLDGSSPEQLPRTRTNPGNEGEEAASARPVEVVRTSRLDDQSGRMHHVHCALPVESEPVGDAAQVGQRSAEVDRRATPREASGEERTAREQGDFLEDEALGRSPSIELHTFAALEGVDDVGGSTSAEAYRSDFEDNPSREIDCASVRGGGHGSQTTEGGIEERQQRHDVLPGSEATARHLPTDGTSRGNEASPTPARTLERVYSEEEDGLDETSTACEAKDKSVRNSFDSVSESAHEDSKNTRSASACSTRDSRSSAGLSHTQGHLPRGSSAVVGPTSSGARAEDQKKDGHSSPRPASGGHRGDEETTFQPERAAPAPAAQNEALRLDSDGSDASSTLGAYPPELDDCTDECSAGGLEPSVVCGETREVESRPAPLDSEVPSEQQMMDWSKSVEGEPDEGFASGSDGATSASKPLDLTEVHHAKSTPSRALPEENGVPAGDDALPHGTEDDDFEDDFEDDDGGLGEEAGSRADAPIPVGEHADTSDLCHADAAASEATRNSAAHSPGVRDAVDDTHPVFSDNSSEPHLERGRRSPVPDSSGHDAACAEHVRYPRCSEQSVVAGGEGVIDSDSLRPRADTGSSAPLAGGSEVDSQEGHSQHTDAGEFPENVKGNPGDTQAHIVAGNNTEAREGTSKSTGTREDEDDFEETFEEDFEEDVGEIESYADASHPMDDEAADSGARSCEQERGAAGGLDGTSKEALSEEKDVDRRRLLEEERTRESSFEEEVFEDDFEDP